MRIYNESGGTRKWVREVCVFAYLRPGEGDRKTILRESTRALGKHEVPDTETHEELTT
jgi:hypothetical protein